MVEEIAQEWLQKNHENSKSTVKEIKINGRSENTELKGEIKFEGYDKLEVVWLVSTKKLTKVIFKNCPAIKDVNINVNEITEIDGLDGLTELRELSCGDNKLTKIDLSKNIKLVSFRYHQNPQLTSENIKGLGSLTQIVSLFGGPGVTNSGVITGTSIDLTSISKEALEDAATKLNIDVQGKTVTEIKDLIEGRGKRDLENKTKLDTDLPGLLNPKGEVDDNKSKEIKGELEEIKEVHNVSGHPNNNEILTNSKFDQGKLDKLVDKGKDYDKLATDNPDLVENGKISQDKITGLKDANKDAGAAIVRLGVPDLKIPTLDAKLGDGTNLSHIPTTLKDLLAQIKKLEDALSKVGINPKGSDVEQQLEKLKNDSNKLNTTVEVIKENQGEEW